MDAVFGNDLLLEIILKFAINGKTTEIFRKNLCSVRLVQKHWLGTASRLVQKIGCRQSTHELELHEENSMNQSTHVKANGKLLDRFISTFTANDHLQISVLPGSLFVGVGFFQAENYNSLLNYFSQCGQHLKDLSIDFPIYGGTMPLIFPWFTLPNLQNINFEFSDFNGKNEERSEVFGDNRNALAFLQLILNASPKLQVFQLSYSDKNCMPAHFKYIQLPETVTEVIFENEFTTKLGEFMLRQNLPNLEHLQLNQEYSDTENSSVFKVLERFSKTLKNVSISGTNIQFPLMTSLERLCFPSSKINMANYSNLSILPPFVPKLKAVLITGYLKSWSNKFAQFGVFNTVKILELGLGRGREAANFSFQVIKRLHKAFPNLERLSLMVNMNKMTSLKYLVGHMNRLKVLRVSILGKVDGSSTKRFESVLLGLPNKAMRSRILNLSVTLALDPNSITELHTLSLSSRYKLEDGESSLLTQSLFTLGFQRMIKLRKLLLAGKFQPTTEMEEMWRNQDKVIKYCKEGM